MKPQETKSSVSPAELKSQAGSSPTLEYMVAKKMPLTRETFLNLSYPEGAPNPMPAELEMEIPEMFREPHSTAESTGRKVPTTTEEALLDWAANGPRTENPPKAPSQ